MPREILENQSDDQDQDQKNETESPGSSTTSSSLDELKSLQAEIDGETTAPAKETPVPQANFADVFLGAEAVAGLCKTVFLVIAVRAGERWKLEDEEARQLGDAADRVLAKYMPAVLAGYGAEVTLAVTLLAIVSRRMMVTEKTEDKPS